MDLDAQTDISNICRLCLNDSNEMESLYTPLEEIFEDNVMCLYDIMQKLSPTKVSNNAKYPMRLCLNCVSLLTTAYKVNRLIEISQYQLGSCLKEDLQMKKRNIGSKFDAVEIISGKGKYNLKDILIVEDDTSEKSNYEGFLRNLGSAISADFVSKDTGKKKLKEDDYHVVNIVPLSNSEECEDQRVTIRVIAAPTTESTSPTELTTPIREPRRCFRCNFCNKIFTSRATLHRHKESHVRKKSYLCQICGYSTSVRTTLSNHMLLKHQGKRFACEVCGKKYLSNSHLRYHMLIHKNERQYLCTVCGKSFNYASSLEYHMRIHTGEKKYKCTYCNRAFSMRCGLNRHLRTHTGLRPYKCSFCDKAFRSKGEVSCHEMTHTGYRPYHCKLCGKGFTKTHNLKIHMLGHSGPFLCEICQRGFTETVYVKLHMKVAHGLHDFAVNSSHILVVQEEDIGLEDLNETLIITTE